MRVTEIQNGMLGIQRIPGGPNSWRLTITDRDTKEVIWVDIDDRIAQQVVEKLSSGITIAKTMPRA